MGKERCRVYGIPGRSPGEVLLHEIQLFSQCEAAHKVVGASQVITFGGLDSLTYSTLNTFYFPIHCFSFISFPLDTMIYPRKIYALFAFALAKNMLCHATLSSGVILLVIVYLSMYLLLPQIKTLLGEKKITHLVVTS